MFRVIGGKKKERKEGRKERRKEGKKRDVNNRDGDDELND